MNLGLTIGILDFLLIVVVIIILRLRKIDFSRQGNFILASLLIHFIFFGYLCNIYLKGIGENILFLYQVMFNSTSYISAIILFIVVFIMVFREDFYEYGIRNSIWLVPVIIIESWIWYFFIVEFNILIIFEYFIRYESYLTILSLLGINLVAAIAGAYAKQIYVQRFKKVI
jgi:hypothetical protein